MPTSYRLRAVQLAHAAAEIAAARTVWASVDVLTPSGWARRECERLAEAAPDEWPRLLSATEEWLLWREAAWQAAQGHPLLDSRPLAESLQRASELAAAYHIPLRPADGDTEAALLYEAQRGVEARCRSLNATTLRDLLPRLEQRARAAPLLLRGFDSIPPWLGRVGGDSGVRAAAASPGEARVRAVRAEDGLAQLEAIARWCRQRLSAQADARLLVMLPGPPGPRERLARLIEDGLDPRARIAPTPAARATVAIEAGDAFGSLALPSHALLTLGILAGVPVERERISAWLTAPYWSAPGAAPRAHLARLLRERGAMSLGLRELLGALQLAPRQHRMAARELDIRLRQAQRRMGEGSGSTRRWSERFEAGLAALGWPGELAAQSTGHRLRLRWRELLEQFGELAPCAGSLDRDAALELLRALALRSTGRGVDDGAPVTLSGALADPVVLYDGIWVGSLSADQLPIPATPDPFLPLRAQLTAGVPEANAGARRRQAEVLLAAWRASTGELVLSVPAQDEDRRLLPSPVFAGLTFEDDRRAGRLWLPLQLQRAARTEQICDVRGVSFNALTPLPAGTRALTLQNACAFRAYAELRLGALPPEYAEPGVPMNQRGLLLHGALQALWEEVRDSQRLAALEPGALQALIDRCVRRAAHAVQAEAATGRRRARRANDAQFDLFAVLSPALERECQRAIGLIQRLCALERTRPPFTVEATEHVAELALGGGRVRMRLDRVDRIAGGRAVLDYKSGRPGSPDWYGERPTHPQLLAYLAALGSDVLALATVNITAREVRFTGVAATNDLLPKVRATTGPSGALADWSAQQLAWRTLIERLIRAFLSGDAQIDPAPGACDHCHITDICRIGAHQTPESSVHADEADD